MRRVLIVTADDFGLTEGICRGILAAAAGGVVTSTSVLAVGPALPRWAGALADSGLGVGAHLALVGEDPPLLSAREIPTLIVGGGGFPLSWRRVVTRASLGRIDPDEVKREWSAQLQRLDDLGLAVSHVDSHQNLHLWPAFGRVLVDLATERGIGAVRAPHSGGVGPVGLGVRSLSRWWRRTGAGSGLAFPEAAAGLDEAGRLDGDRVEGLLVAWGRSGVGSAELASHPGAGPDPERRRYDWGYRWEEELEMLCSPRIRSAVARSPFTPGTFADLGVR